MFTAITWERFFTTAVLLVGGYYFITTFLLYHREIKSWTKSRGRHSPEKVSGTPEPIEDHPSLKGGNRILGNINMEERIATPRTSSVDAEDLSFAATDDNDIEIDTPVSVSRDQTDHMIIGSVADLLQEIKTLIQVIKESNWDKAESTSLFRTLLLRYPNVKSTDFRDAISLYICQAALAQLSFTIELHEAITWWEDGKDTRK